jgi:hypothetical protein
MEAIWGYRQPGNKSNDSSTFTAKVYTGAFSLESTSEVHQSTSSGVQREEKDMSLIVGGSGAEENSKEDDSKREKKDTTVDSNYDELFSELEDLVNTNSLIPVGEQLEGPGITSEHCEVGTPASSSINAVEDIDDSLSKRCPNAFEAFVRQAEVMLQDVTWEDSIRVDTPLPEADTSTQSSPSSSSSVHLRTPLAHDDNRNISHLDETDAPDAPSGLFATEKLSSPFHSAHTPNRIYQEVEQYMIGCKRGRGSVGDDETERTYLKCRRERLQAIALELLDIAREE